MNKKLTEDDKKLIVKLKLIGKTNEEIVQMTGKSVDVNDVINRFLAPTYSPLYEGD